LGDSTTGVEAGEVFHEFATFCGNQLSSPSNRDDFLRAQKMRDRREDEVVAYEKLGGQKSLSKSEKTRIVRGLAKAKLWFAMEDDEYTRLHQEREIFLKMSIQNYLLSLAASDKHDDNVLKLVALWLEFAESSLANKSIAENLSKVASHKFARLMNQLCSRLQADDTSFQKLLADLIFQICRDHPFHGLYQLYSNSTQPRLQDDATKARQAAAVRLAHRLKNDKRASLFWQKVKHAHDLYDAVAMYKDRQELQSDRDYDINGFSVMVEMAKKIAKLVIPPSTMTVAIRPDRNYSQVPTITRFSSKIKIAGGLSAPKIITAITSDGVRYRQLVRSSFSMH
jgi:serine-protein kinase ATM